MSHGTFHAGDSGREGPAGPPFASIAIVGLGLIGGSIALAARQAWPAVHLIGVDANPEVLEAAAARDLIGVAATELQAAAEADLVVLAAPVAVNVQLLAGLAGTLRPGTVVTDAGSTKRAIVNSAIRLFSGDAPGRDRVVFIGGHPIAGSAAGGLGAALPDLFAGACWILTPGERAPDGAVRSLQAFVAGLGARPVTMAAAEHDRLMAFASHLPQLVASLLMQTVGDAVGEEGLAFAGPGLRDTTRLADSPSDIWMDIVATNTDNIGTALAVLRAALAQMEAHLTDARHLSRVFGTARRFRNALPAGPGTRPRP